MSRDREQFEGHRDQVRERLRRPGRPRERVTVGGCTVELVGDAERVDRDWEDREAQRKREEWDSTRDDRLRQRIARREGMTAGQRLDHAMQHLALRRGGMRSRSIAALRSGPRPSSSLPPEPGDSTRHLEHHLTLIAHHVEAIERELDAQDGLRVVLPEGRWPGNQGAPGNTGSYSDSRMMSTAERNRVVFDDFQGVRAEDVAREAPYLGTSARTIERARVNEAARRGLRVRPVDGTVLGEQEVTDQRGARKAKTY